MTLLTRIAWLNAAVVAAVGWNVWRGLASIARLSDAPLEPPGGPPPGVSIVVAARNEARHLAGALGALLQLDYPQYEVLVVDDRSDDATPAILDRLAAQSDRLRVLRISELPSGWLGKNYALHQGARQARFPLLLFTDADVTFHRSALRRAAALMAQRRLDHLAAAPRLDMPGWLLSSFAVAFTLLFSAFIRPWRARAPRSRAHVGVGAFNLVRAEAYWAAGGHERIALRPDDDLKLGKTLKQAGFRQDLANAADLVRVPWYGSLGELVRGLEKNAFAGADYCLGTVAALTGLVLAFDVWPFLAVWLPWPWPARAAYAAAAAVLLGLAFWAARDIRQPPAAALGFPVAAALFVYIVWRATWLALVRRGVRWRDTWYSLRELKQNTV